MNEMNAAVVTSFEEPPRYLPAAVPRPAGREVLVEVLAAGLHPRVRSGASGTHYTSTGRLPMIPGIDGVGRRADGAIVYFAAGENGGTMAEMALVDPHRSIELPPGADVTRVAAAMNPAMSSWVALRRRVELAPGARVLVLGATGNAGAMAVQIAKLLGAGEVVGCGRDPGRLERLAELGADRVVRLGEGGSADDAERLAAVAAEVDVVLDYLWGEPAQAAMIALLRARSDRSRPLDWVQIGSVAGATLELPSAALRSCNLRLQGSGQGSVAARDYLAELPSLVLAIGEGAIAVSPKEERLSDVERVWGQAEIPGRRTVLIP